MSHFKKTAVTLAAGVLALTSIVSTHAATLAGEDNGAKAKATSTAHDSDRAPALGAAKPGDTPSAGGASTSTQATPGPTNPKPGQ